ncbi:hypothetical protein F2Q69_00005481 [Brassica cretica]|uniref:Uncharacterized protein n=1 Tax=Brassica cretica TaxID=69181 RepID=A0A8S9P0I3_BRACR|nr:hypothetical protein F2Q69_00005481 [Brassica cretica]
MASWTISRLAARCTASWTVSRLSNSPYGELDPPSDPPSGKLDKSLDEPHPTRPMASGIDQSNLPLRKLDELHPTRPRRGGSTKSNSPLGELDQSFPIRHYASRISPMLCIPVSVTPPFGPRSNCLLFRLDRSNR